MNNERRKTLEGAKALIDEARGKLADAREIIETAESEEREYYDNMPEGIQAGERGQKAEASADSLSDALNQIDDCDLDNIDAAIDIAMEA